MNRRQWMVLGGGTLVGASLLGVGASLLGGVTPAHAKVLVPYTRETFDAALAAGKPLLLDTYASW